MSKPAATVGSMHTCPMYDGKSPHVGGPVIGPGVPTVLIGGKPAAVVGDKCACNGAPDTIVQGVANVLIGGKPAATMGSMTAHGGVIVEGNPTVIIGSGTSTPAQGVTALDKLDFPKFDFVSKVLGTNKEAQQRQQQLQEEAQQQEEREEISIFNLQWLKGDRIVSGSKVFRDVTVNAEVHGVPDGQTATFTITEPTNHPDQQSRTFTLQAQVQNKKVTQTWRIEEEEEENES